MYRSFILFIATIVSLSLCTLNAQNKMIKGIVQNRMGEGIANALVLLSDTMHTNQNQAEYIDVLETDSLGCFMIIDKQNFNRIYISRIGYQPVTMTFKAQNFLKITMIPNEDFKLEEIEVKGYKQAVKMNTNGLEYDMKYSPIKQGNILDALRFIPIVHVNRGTIQIVGKSKVKYYLNSKELKLEGNALDSFIQNLSANDIEKIEVITSHDPRFNMDFEQGCINIVTKRKSDEGWKGSAQAKIWKTHHVKGNGNLQLSYAKNKLSTNIFITGSHLSNWNKEMSVTKYKSIDKNTYKESEADEKLSNLGMNGIFNYAMTKKKNLSGDININYIKRDKDEFGFIQYIKNKTNTAYAEIMHNNQIKMNMLRISAGLSYQQYFKNNHMFQSSLNYFHGNGDATVTSMMDSTYNGVIGKPHEHYKEKLPEKSSVWSGDILYKLPLGEKCTMNFEMNAYHWKIDFDDTYWKQNDNKWELNRSMSNHLKVKEWTAKGTVSLQHNLSKKFQGSWGISMQRRNYESEDIYTKTQYEQTFWQPGPFISFNLNPGGKISANYSANYRPINPTFAAMNPFKWYTSATTYRTGNPNLSQIKHFNQNLALQFLQHFMLFASHHYTDDGIVAYDVVKEDGMIETRPENMASTHNGTLYISANNISYLNNRGSIHATAGWTREWYSASIPQSENIYKRVTDSYFAQLDNSITFFPSWPIQMVNSLNYNSKRRSDFYIIPATIYFYISLQKNIQNWSIKLDCTIDSSIYDSGMHLKSKQIMDNSDLNMYTLSKGEAISVGIQISYRFGNKRLKSIRRSNSSSKNLENRL